jgi:hypothetical protein
VKTDDPADDFRSKMVETDFLARVVGFLQDQDSDVCVSSIGVIIGLAEFGTLINYFVLCGD